MTLNIENFVWLLLPYLLLSTQPSFAQNKILDSSTSEPIAYVHIVSENGTLLGLSNIKGYFNPLEIKEKFKLKATDSIELSHISYSNIRITLGSLLDNKLVEMHPSVLFLEDTKIFPLSKNRKILVLKGYFRSYQLNDNRLKAFMDGIVEYYIYPSVTRGLRVKVIECRNYINLSVGYVGNRTGPPYIEKKTILDDVKRQNLLSTINLNEHKVLLNIDSIGNLSFNSQSKTLSINIDYITPEKAYTKTLLGYTAKFLNYSVTEVYTVDEENWNKKSNLLKRYEYRKQLVSNNQSKDKFIEVESTHEFYVLESYYLSKKEMKKIKTFSFFGPRKTKYVNHYWENLEQQGINPIPNFIKDLFDKILLLH